MATLLDILEPLSTFDPSVMLLVGALSREHRAYSQGFWALRHAAYCRGDFVRGQPRTRGMATLIAGSKRKRCNGCHASLAMPWPFDPTLSICNLCTKRRGPAKFRLLSFTEAHTMFMLDVYDLWCIDQFHTSKANKGAEVPALAQRVKFRKDEVVTLACDKYG
jgi:hypothetical protein